MVKKYNFIIITILAIIIPIAYTPEIYLNEAYYNIFSSIATLILGLLFGLSFFYSFIIKKERVPKFVRPLVIFIIIAAFEFLVFYTANLNINIQDLISIIAVTMGIYVGYTNHFTIKQLKTIAIVYCIFGLILGYLSISTYIGAFSVNMADYLVEGKNQVGQIVALCSILSFSLIYFEYNKLVKFLLCCIFLLSMFCLFIIKCKTALLATIMVEIFMFFKLTNTNTIKKVLLTGIPVVLLLFIIFNESLLSTILDMIGLSGKTSMEELTTGRASRNDMALAYTLNNPILGELKHYSYIPLIHNWILLRTVRLGLFFSLPFILFYFYILFYVGKKILKTKTWNISNVGMFLVIVPYISSMVEPGAPFSPNTVYIMHYIIIGMSLSKFNSLNYRG